MKLGLRAPWIVPWPARFVNPPVPPKSEYSPWKLLPTNVAENGACTVPEAVPPDVVTVPVKLFSPENVPVPVDVLMMIVTVPTVVPVKAPVNASPKVSFMINALPAWLVVMLVTPVCTKLPFPGRTDDA